MGTPKDIEYLLKKSQIASIGDELIQHQVVGHSFLIQHHGSNKSDGGNKVFHTETKYIEA